MEFLEGQKRQRRQAWVTALAVILAVYSFGFPVVEAAISKVKLAGGTANARIKSSTGKPIESKPVNRMGVLNAKGSTGAMSVRTYSGGGGLLGAGDCTVSEEPAQGPLANVVSIGGGSIITALVITGTGTVRVTSSGVGNGQVPLANFTVNAENPNEVVEFGNGFSASSTINFTGIDGTACNFLILGQGPGVEPLEP